LTLTVDKLTFLT